MGRIDFIEVALVFVSVFVLVIVLADKVAHLAQLLRSLIGLIFSEEIIPAFPGRLLTGAINLIRKHCEPSLNRISTSYR
jgi:uncharacterized membrane protein